MDAMTSPTDLRKVVVRHRFRLSPIRGPKESTPPGALETGRRVVQQKRCCMCERLRSGGTCICRTLETPEAARGIERALWMRPALVRPVRLLVAVLWLHTDVPGCTVGRKATAHVPEDVTGRVHTNSRTQHSSSVRAVRVMVRGQRVLGRVLGIAQTPEHRSGTQN